jgi:hypothetical protein
MFPQISFQRMIGQTTEARSGMEPDYTDSEIAARRDAALRRALNSPPKPLPQSLRKVKDAPKAKPKKAGGRKSSKQARP